MRLECAFLDKLKLRDAPFKVNLGDPAALRARGNRGRSCPCAAGLEDLRGLGLGDCEAARLRGCEAARLEAAWLEAGGGCVAARMLGLGGCEA